jgi:hypothetical protein
MVLVSVIFVNYNGKEDDIETCLSSLYKQTFKDFEVIFVDNDSQDDSIEYVKKNFPKVRIIESKKNLGFAAGNNLGVRHARGKYVFILNLDTQIEKNCLKELVECAKRNRNSGLCPKILFFDKRDKINTTGIAFSYLGFGWCDNLEKNDKDFLEEKELIFPSGAAFLIDKETFNEVGGFDKNYFIYYEDADLGWRLRLKGYKVVLAPKARVYHKYFFGRHPRKFYFAERNRIITILKNYEIKTLLLILPPFILTELGILFYSLMTDLFLSKLKGYWWILRNIDKIFENRREIQETRKVKDKDIVKYFLSKIEFKEIANPLIEYVLNPILDFYWKIIKPFI